MDTIAFSIALFLSISLGVQSLDSCVNKTKRDVTWLAFAATLAWGWFYWLTH